MSKNNSILSGVKKSLLAFYTPLSLLGKAYRIRGVHPELKQPMSYFQAKNKHFYEFEVEQMIC